MSFIVLQYEAKKRASAADAMKQPYFSSLGPGVHKLPDGKKWQYTNATFFSISQASECALPPIFWQIKKTKKFM
jgi:hypothetical protein